MKGNNPKKKTLNLYIYREKEKTLCCVSTTRHLNLINKMRSHTTTTEQQKNDSKQ